MPSAPSKTLEVVPNPHPDRDYEVTMTVPEFTCLCPMTGQPDFATIRIRYVPDQHLVELKSIKLYLWSYRQEGAFHEDVTNRILNDFVAVANPRWLEVTGDFNVRGGIKTEVRVTHGERHALKAAAIDSMSARVANPYSTGRSPMGEVSRRSA